MSRLGVLPAAAMIMLLLMGSDSFFLRLHYMIGAFDTKPSSAQFCSVSF